MADAAAPEYGYRFKRTEMIVRAIAYNALIEPKHIFLNSKKVLEALNGDQIYIENDQVKYAIHIDSRTEDALQVVDSDGNGYYLKWSEVENAAKNERRSGRTTRIVDAAIQELFEKGFVHVKDHHGDKHTDRLALALVKDRLFREHEHVKWISDRKDPFVLHLQNGLSEKELRDLKNEY